MSGVLGSDRQTDTASVPFPHRWESLFGRWVVPNAPQAACLAREAGQFVVHSVWRAQCHPTSNQRRKRRPPGGGWNTWGQQLLFSDLGAGSSLTACTHLPPTLLNFISGLSFPTGTDFFSFMESQPAKTLLRDDLRAQVPARGPGSLSGRPAEASRRQRASWEVGAAWAGVSSADTSVPSCPQSG